MDSTDRPINTLAEDDRPREKLRAKGQSILTDSELIAILLGSGMQKRSALLLGRDLLERSGGLRDLAQWTVEDFCAVPGIGPAKAIRIVAAFEVGRRFPQTPMAELPVISNSEDAYNQVKTVLADLRHEEFWVLYLSNANRVLKRQRLSQGGMTGTVTDIRIIFRNALTYRATGVILAHNHPSGNLHPSKADRSLTEKATSAGRLMDISVLDHLIVTANDYVSFADEGWMSPG